MLSHRTLLTINPTSDTDVVQGVVDKTFAWLRDKGLDVGAFTANGDFAVDEHASVRWIAPIPQTSQRHTD